MEDLLTPILSDEEVGALYQAVQTSGVDPDAPCPPTEYLEQPFEPRPLEAGSHELKRLVDRVHGVLGVEAGAAVGAVLRFGVSLAIGAVEEREPDELGLSGHETRVRLQASGQPLGTLLISEALIRAAADRMLGGRGIPSAPNRPLSDIERRVAERTVQALAGALVKSWRPWLTGETQATQGLDDRSRPRQGALLVAELRLSMESRELLAQLVYDAEALGRATRLEAPRGGAKAGGASLAERLHSLPLAVAVQAPDFALTIRELLALRPGMTLALDRTSGLSVDILVERSPRFRGRLVVDETGARTIAIQETLKPRAPGAPEVKHV